MPTDGMDQEIRTRLDQKLYAPAFELLVTNYRDKVLRLAYSILGDRVLAEDTSQDVFVRIWRALPAYRGLASVSTWVYAITRNTCLTALKRARTINAIDINDPSITLPREQPRPEPRRPDPLRALSQLPEKYRQVIILFYMEEKSYQEVADLLDIPIGTVKTYLHRAKKALAAALMDEKMKGGR